MKDMDIAKEAEKIIHNLVAWVEVNRQLRPAWVKENFPSMVVQSCKVFRNGELTYYNWKWLFRNKNLFYTFDSEGRLKELMVQPDWSSDSVSVFSGVLNRAFKQTLSDVEENGLPSSVTQVLLDRLDRVKTLGLGQPDNLVVIDMRRLDSISFRPTVRA